MTAAAQQGPGQSQGQEQTSASFFYFAQLLDQVAATTKRNEKAALLGSYFASLHEDLPQAARFLAGNPFPLRDQRTTNVGGAALLSAIAVVTGADPKELRDQLVTLGDLGEVALWAASQKSSAAPAPTEAASRADVTQEGAAAPAGAQPDLTLASVAAAFAEIAAHRGAKRKLALVTALLSRAAPLSAKYLVKLLLSDLRVGLQEGAVEDALARWAGVEIGKVQGANMLIGDIGETAVLVREGRLAEARMRLFHPLKFMLATPAADLEEVRKQMPAAFVVEDKYDGIRAQVHVGVSTDGVEHGVVHQGQQGDQGPRGQGNRVAIFSRTLDDITESFPDLVAPLAALLQGPTGLILDGEVLPVQGEAILPFQELQKRLGRKTLPAALRAAVPVAFVAYDVLYAHGRVLMEEPFSVRRAVLESLPLPGPVARKAASRLFDEVAALDTEFDAARARGNEGLMVKDPASPYRPGSRGRDWLKIKRALSTLDVVVTAVEVGNGKRRHLLSNYTFAVRASETDPTLLNVGKAYSGLTDAELEHLSAWFRAHTLSEYANGKERVVEPRIVVEVAFDRVQASKRHKSGFALRFPRILRIRDDKPPEEIDTLQTVQALAAQVAPDPAARSCAAVP